MKDSAIERLFVTKLYRAQIARAARLNAELARTCLIFAQDDTAGRRWAKQHDYRGYTSYASLDDLPRRAPVFAELAQHLDEHARHFARALDFAGKLSLDSLWINVLDRGGVHTGHIHPHSALSGTYYVALPKGASALRFEDPRLGLMMAAPRKRERAARDNRQFVSIAPKPGTLLMWESWLKHEVPLNSAPGKRISVSFNYS
ncbi:MAG: TIGR02466 family protein [Rhizomicrobium sp.]|jgi:uncharacterized protein (TIGR02466 family)